MQAILEQKSQSVTALLNGTISSLSMVIPVAFQTEKPQLLNEKLQIQFGVLIGFIGDIKGKFVLKADTSIFSSFGQVMYGMPLEGEMLSSFAGELGNMVAGSLSTKLAEDGIKTDITSPTVLEGNTNLSGFENALKVIVHFDGIGEMDIYLLLDQ